MTPEGPVIQHALGISDACGSDGTEGDCGPRMSVSGGSVWAAGERDLVPRNTPAQDAESAPTRSASKKLTFMDLPLELREIIWQYALPGPRVFNALVYASAGLKMQLLERANLNLSLAHVCFESRRVVQESGYILAWRDEDQHEDPGVWFNRHVDIIERTIWGPGDFWGLETR